MFERTCDPRKIGDRSRTQNLIPVRRNLSIEHFSNKLRLLRNWFVFRLYALKPDRQMPYFRAI